MNRRLTRRRFMQLALAGSAVTVSASVTRIIFAQSASLTLIGVRAGPVPSSTTDVPEVDTTEVESATGGPGTASVAVGVLLQSFNLATGQVQTLQAPQSLQDGQAPVLRSNEAVTGCTVLADGTVVLAITPVSGSTNERDPTRLTRLSTPATTVPISGLKKDEKLGDLVATTDGRLLGLVAKRNGTPPVRLVAIDPLTGTMRVVDTVNLPGKWPFKTLAQSSDGQLYTAAVGWQGEAHLVQVGSGRNQTITPVLTVDGTVWNNGLESLVYSPAGQFLAFGALRYETPNALYTVDVGSGAMSKLYDFDVSRVAIAHA